MISVGATSVATRGAAETLAVATEVARKTVISFARPTGHGGSSMTRYLQ